MKVPKINWIPFDWDEGQKIEVLAYAELPTDIKEYKLVEDNNG